MSIYGLGTDIVKISRISNIMKKTNGRFAYKILGPKELNVYNSEKMNEFSKKIIFLATRFSVKESFVKAIGIGMNSPMNWRYIQTLNEKTGKPIIVLSKDLYKFINVNKLIFHVSISSENNYAISTVIIENI